MPYVRNPLPEQKPGLLGLQAERGTQLGRITLAVSYPDTFSECGSGEPGAWHPDGSVCWLVKSISYAAIFRIP
jgi:hypothetical protein